LGRQHETAHKLAGRLDWDINAVVTQHGKAAKRKKETEPKPARNSHQTTTLEATAEASIRSHTPTETPKRADHTTPRGRRHARPRAMVPLQHYTPPGRVKPPDPGLKRTGASPLPSLDATTTLVASKKPHAGATPHRHSTPCHRSVSKIATRKVCRVAPPPRVSEEQQNPNRMSTSSRCSTCAQAPPS
jgi:hypothetical protein